MHRLENIYHKSNNKIEDDHINVTYYAGPTSYIVTVSVTDTLHARRKNPILVRTLEHTDFV